MGKSKVAEIDAREYDTTQLREAGHGQMMGRDYSAHFFRWSFARRFITAKDHVLEIGCGQDKPLSKLLNGATNHYARYVGVDMNKLKPSSNRRNTFLGEFNFVERWREVQALRPEGYDVAVSFEVLEHMNSKYQLPFLKGCFSILRPGGKMLLSTPAYDGVRMAANHIRELTVDELNSLVLKAGFKVSKRFGTFMDIKHIGKTETDRCPTKAVAEVRKALAEYFDNDAISNIFGPLYPDQARNCLWVLEK